GYQGVVDQAKINIIQLFHVVVNRMNIDCAAFLWWDFMNNVVEGERYKESYADKFATSMLHDDVDDSGDRIKPGSHKEHLKFVDDDDDNEEEKTDEKKDDEMGSLDIRTEKMQTPIPTPPRSPRIILSSDKNLNQELTVTVSPSTTFI
ncbi:hypothetical protein Tco_0082039, partial [Tanacetum coccineum]